MAGAPTPIGRKAASVTHWTSGVHGDRYEAVLDVKPDRRVFVFRGYGATEREALTDLAARLTAAGYTGRLAVRDRRVIPVDPHELPRGT